MQDTEQHSMWQTEYVTVRDFLVATVALANANRSGVLANLTLEEFHQSRLVDNKYGTQMEPSHLVMRPTSNKPGKRVYNKRHYCIYCKMAFFHLPRHLYAQHAEERDVAEILAVNGDRRKALLTRLRNLGAEQHNIQVHKDGSGEIPVVYRPSWCMDDSLLATDCTD